MRGTARLGPLPPPPRACSDARAREAAPSPARRMPQSRGVGLVWGFNDADGATRYSMPIQDSTRECWSAGIKACAPVPAHCLCRARGAWSNSSDAAPYEPAPPLPSCSSPPPFNEPHHTHLPAKALQRSRPLWPGTVTTGGSPEAERGSHKAPNKCTRAAVMHAGLAAPPIRTPRTEHATLLPDASNGRSGARGLRNGGGGRV
jgi:hypothetical protein